MMISSTQHHTVEVTHLKVRETARKYDALVQRESAPSTAASASRAVETHALHRVSDLRARFEGVQGPLAMRHSAASAAPLAGSSRRFDVYGTALIHLHEQVATSVPLPHADADADSASDEHEYDQEYDHECDHGDVARADDVCVDAEHVGSASSNHATTIAGADAAAAATESDGAAAPAPSWFQIALHAFWMLLQWLGWALTAVWLVAVVAAHVGYAGMRLLWPILSIVFAGAEWFAHWIARAALCAPVTHKMRSTSATKQATIGAKSKSTTKADTETETETESDRETELTLQLVLEDDAAQVTSSSVSEMSELALELETEIEEMSELALEFDNEAKSELALELETETEEMSEPALGFETEIEEMSELALEFDNEAKSELALELETETEEMSEPALGFETEIEEMSELALEFDNEAKSELALEPETVIVTETVTETESVATFPETIKSTLGLEVDTDTASNFPVLLDTPELTLEPAIDPASGVHADSSAANLVAKASARVVAPAPATKRTRTRARHRVMVHHGNPYDTDANSKYLLYETASTAYERRKMAAAAQRSALGAANKSSWR